MAITANSSAPAATGEVRRAPDPRHRLVIEPALGRSAVNWRELWRYRELAYVLAWRDIQIRYKQTALGAAWAVLQPLLNTLVFTIFFGRLAGLEARTGGARYPLFVFAGLLPWLFFANAIGNGGKSLVGSAGLVTKVYFPRLLIPLGAMGAYLVDFAVSFAVLLGMMAWYGAAVSWTLVLVPVFLLGVLLMSVGTAALLSALTVAYRDFQHVVPFLVQIGMFVTPVIYPATIVPEPWRWLFALNPMAGLIGGFRAALLGLPIDWSLAGPALPASVVVCWAGVAYFRTAERRFADVI